MVRLQFRALGLVLALTTVGLMSACASGPETFKGAAPDPVAEAQYHQLSPTANLDTHDLTYRGTLPPNLAPVAEKTNDLGDPVFLSTQNAVKQYGDQRVRQLVVQDVKLCGRAGIQQLALNDLRRQADAVEASRKNVRNKRNGILLGAAASEIGGNVLAGIKFGAPYGGVYALGSLIPSLANQYVYKMVLDQGDMEAGLWLAQSRFWYNQNEFWLESMNDWCPAFMNWVQQNGQIVHQGS